MQRYAVGVKKFEEPFDRMTVIINAGSHGEALLKAGILSHIRFEELHDVTHLIYYIKP